MMLERSRRCVEKYLKAMQLPKSPQEKQARRRTPMVMSTSRWGFQVNSWAEVSVMFSIIGVLKLSPPFIFQHSDPSDSDSDIKAKV